MINSFILEATELKKTFHVGFRRRKVEAVRGVSFRLRKNEILGIVGPNGAGKTTTLKMLTGLVRPDHGTAHMFGQDVSDVNTRRRLGYLPEGPYFYEHLKADELLRFYGQLTGVDNRTLNGRIEKLIELVGLGHARDRPIRKFSKGMRQRVGLAQALINDPELVILDEPQSGLDPTGRKEVRDLISSLKKEGKTVMFSSHILPDVEAVCDRVIVIHQGRVREEGVLADLAGEKVETWEVVMRDVDPTTLNSPGLKRTEKRGDVHVAWYEGTARVETVIADLAASGGSLVSVTPERLDLEDIYLRDTVGDDHAKSDSSDGFDRGEHLS